jgi:hypothetical protein
MNEEEELENADFIVSVWALNDSLKNIYALLDDMSKIVDKIKRDLDE